MKHYPVAIPSYKRADLLITHTLPTLALAEVPHDAISVFVADQDEEETYRSVLPGTIQIVVGRKGLAEQRKIINDHYPPGQPYLSFDDDVERITIRTTENKMGPLPGPLHNVAAEGFAACLATNTKMWGPFATDNSMFLRPVAQVGPYFLPGSFWGGFAHDHSIEWPDTDNVEDMRRCLRSEAAHGGVVRLSYLTHKIPHAYKKATPGGIYGNLGDQRGADHDAELQKLAVEFPHRLKLEYAEPGATKHPKGVGKIRPLVQYSRSDTYSIPRERLQRLARRLLLPA